MLNVNDVAEHWALSPDTIRRHIKAGSLEARKRHRTLLLEWDDVWAAECGPYPKGPSQDIYKTPLLRKRDLQTGVRVDLSTVDRWIAMGLPTLWVPHSYRGCSQHAPNENVLKPVSRDALCLMAGLFWDIGQTGGPK